MAILTIILFVILAMAIFYLFLITRGDYKEKSALRLNLKYIKRTGLLALVIGFLGQMLGLSQAFGVIEKAGDVSAGLLAGGLKVSMISPIYGLLIFLFSYIIWIVLDVLLSRRA